MVRLGGYTGSRESGSMDDTTSGAFLEDDDDSELSDGEEELNDGETVDDGASKDKDDDGGLDDDFEDKAVQCFRLFVLFVLLGAMAAGGVSTWYFITKDEQQDFQREFQLVAEATFEESTKSVEEILSDTKTLASTVTALTTDPDTEWPFFYESSFPMLGQNYQESTRARAVAIAPLVETFSNKLAWENFSVSNQEWIVDGLEWEGLPVPETMESIPSIIWKRDSHGEMIPDLSSTGPFAPMWQMSGAPTDPSIINFNALSDTTFSRAAEKVRDSNQPVLSALIDPTIFFGDSLVLVQNTSDTPNSLLVYPIFAINNNHNDKPNEEENDIVAALIADLTWDSFLNPLPDGYQAVVAVFSDNCNSSFTYQLNDINVKFLGYGDVHDTSFNYLKESTAFAPFLETAHTTNCEWTLTLYPTEEFHDEFITNRPAVVTAIVVVAMFIVSVIFCLYDGAVHTRQRRILAIAAQSERILSILYPKTIRDRLFGTSPEEDEESKSEGGSKEKKNKKKKKNKRKSHVDHHKAAKYQLKTFMTEDATGGGTKTDSETTGDPFEDKPIADLFPTTTVMFADIAGFTAWSSVREPSQVFTLLETVYRAFDVLAKRRRVFKVETVGDCYVAVTGLPEPLKDHAIAMARFARDCVEKFSELVGQLETTLGPDTGELGIRVGLHSGPVTAGVLRGDKSRFQLFGDTVNTAARIETTGKKNKIHISMETAEHLQSAGKASWIRRREQAVEAKGKGKLQTYWLLLRDESGAGSNEGSENEEKDYEKATPIPKEIGHAAPNLKTEDPDELEKSLPPKVQRLVKWNVDVLIRLLKQIVAKRNAMGNKRNYDMMLNKSEQEIRRKFMVLDEVVEIISLPGFDQRIYKRQEDPNQIELPKAVVDQMRLYVSCIAAMYRDNHFHNFEHASHVMMSVSKLLSRIVAADDLWTANEDATKSKDFGFHVHDHTYGITSDPMTQFSVVLAALIHDVDHVGVSNAQLVKEDHKLARLFKAKSVAEQNSIVLAWDTLMDPRFYDLRRTIYADPFELERFRQLLANTVMATDIFDKQLGALRKKRWDVAFSVKQDNEESTKDDINRKATIVIEHLIQASDVAHTMQHWHIYRKWNERLFAEMSVAFQNGRMEKNPAEFWYHGELGFFDNYVIPLAKKLKDCGVFGVSSDEYLNYALENRREWANNGEEVLNELITKYQAEIQKPEAVVANTIPRAPPTPTRSSVGKKVDAGIVEKLANPVQ